MAAKDELYDPAVNYNSDSDSELNNAKGWISPTSSPPTNSYLKDVFIHNSLGYKGGPQADKPQEQTATATAAKKPFRCKGESCGKETDELWDGNHYRCSINIKNKKDWDRKHQFCYDCAHNTINGEKRRELRELDTGNRKKCPGKACMFPPDHKRRPKRIEKEIG